VVSCAQLATVPALGRCPAGATAAAFPADGFAGPLYGIDATAITWPTANIPARWLDTLAVDAINVATNGSVPPVEQARTVLENAPAYPAAGAPSTIGDLIAQSNATNNGSASSRLPSRCWHASQDPKSRETNEPAESTGFGRHRQISASSSARARPWS
jgi:hypothetical protein